MCRKIAKHNDSDPQNGRIFSVSDCQYFSFFLRLAPVRSANFIFYLAASQFARSNDNMRSFTPQTGFRMTNPLLLFLLSSFKFQISSLSALITSTAI